MKRIALATVFGVVLVALAAAVLVPLEPETCPQLYADVFHAQGDALLQQETLARCVGQMISTRAALPPPPEPPRAPVPEPAPAPAPKPPEGPTLSAQQRAVVERLRDVICPQLTDHQSVHLFHFSSGDYFQLAVYCPECRFIRAPPDIVHHGDGSLFCHDDQPERTCRALLPSLGEAEVRVDSITPAALLGCR